MLLLFNGWWMLSNPEIFENAFQWIPNQTTPMKSGHLVTFKVNWATPILIMGISSIFIYLVKSYFPDQLQRWGYSLMRKNIEVDEDLPNFFECVRLSQADEIAVEEKNMKENFGIEINDPDTV